jgi:hypothetical protein
MADEGRAQDASEYSRPPDRALIEIASLAWRVSDVLDAGKESAQWGSFTGLPPKVQLEGDGRQVTLLSPFSFTQTDGLEWPVPAGVNLDGASIPPYFWSIIGGPFEGPYRNASIIHDHYCNERTRAWRDTHLMFYEAMRCSGTPSIKARIMFYAVYRFGPRWPDPDSETRVGETAWAPPIELESLAADARAIAEHGLSAEEVMVLADARDSETSPSLGIELPSTTAGADARLVVITGGSGAAEDLDVVVRAAALLPAPVIRRFRREGIRIVACRGSITDFERDLAGVVPRGWAGLDKTWDDVPGAYLPARKRVVIGTIGLEGGGRTVPRMGQGHGSTDLVVHEALHGFDYSSGHAVLEEPRFVSAREADFDRLGTYERQEGQAGAEETFAESGARFSVDPEGMAAAWPMLHQYWGEGPLEDRREGFEGEEAFETRPIGTAVDCGDGLIALDLRADGPEGVIGHARFILDVGDCGYDEIADTVFREGRPSKGAFLIPPFIERRADHGRRLQERSHDRDESP